MAEGENWLGGDPSPFWGSRCSPGCVRTSQDIQAFPAWARGGQEKPLASGGPLGEEGPSPCCGSRRDGPHRPENQGEGKATPIQAHPTHLGGHRGSHFPAGNAWVRAAGSPTASGVFAGRALVKPEGTRFPRATCPERGHRGRCPPPAKSAIVLHLTPLPPPVHVKTLPRGLGFIGLWRPRLHGGQSCGFREGLFLLVVFCYLFCF